MERAEVHYLSSLDLDPNFGVGLADYAKFLAETGGILIFDGRVQLYTTGFRYVCPSIVYG